MNLPGCSLRHRLQLTLIVLVGVTVIAPAAGAQGAVAAGAQPANLHLELPVYDAPFNRAGGFAWPSMQQSLMVSKDVYALGHWFLDQLAPGRTTVGEGFAIVGFDVLMSWMPLSDSWVHEEWHRAVMTRRHVNSYDDIYGFPLFADTISVSHVADEDLVRMKQRYPADFVRLPEAGIEGESELMLALEKDAFFYDTRSFNIGLLWLTKLNSLLYVITSASAEANRLTDQMNAKEGNVAVRDFTGLDFTGWVYDLHRPDEPYAARGAHPSGVGIDRYIRYADLSGGERHYLRLQGRLQLLNLLDPNLIGFKRFVVGPQGNAQGRVEWMLSAYHQPTPFGFDAGLNFFLRAQGASVQARVHNYSSGDHPWLPGIEAQLVDSPARIGSHSLYLSPRVSLWLQPHHLRFTGTGVHPGALVGLRAAVPFNSLARVFVETEAKSEGWVPGNVALEPAVSGRLGVEGIVF
jgi:hypothetical protein